MAEFFATTSMGVEPVLSQELIELGAQNVKLGRGGVYFEGDQELMYRANLWLRSATRIYMPLREFSAITPVMLYDQIKRMKWEQYLDPDKTLLVDCTIAGVRRAREERNSREDERGGRFDRGNPRSREKFSAQRKPVEETANISPKSRQMLTHSHYVSLKIKDAIVDRLREKFGARPDVDKNDPDLKLHAYMHGTKCTLSIDTSGKSLHERGYRKEQAEAPMKENLAAALILYSKWNGKKPFYDPMCGSGTIPIEAALIAKKIAPGRFRDYFGFMALPDFNKELWRKVLKEAEDAEVKNVTTMIYGSDQSGRMLEMAKHNAERAGVANIIHFHQKKFEESSAPATKEPGIVVMNPPYGERLGASENMIGFYKTVGNIFKHQYKTWQAFVFTGNLEAAKFIGLKPNQKTKLFNGAMECRLLRFDVY